MSESGPTRASWPSPPGGRPQRRSPIPEPADQPPPPPHSLRELALGFAWPFRVLDLVLAEPDRLTRTLSQRTTNVLLVALLLFASLVFALPYGAVLDPARIGRVFVLYVGSMAICLPSLIVFGAYTGFRMGLARSLALALIVTSVASLFTFGFSPILWFLRATISDESELVGLSHLSVFFLSISLLAGIVHLYRCLARLCGERSNYPSLVFVWQLLLLFITYRMARLLELLP